MTKALRNRGISITLIEVINFIGTAYFLFIIDTFFQFQFYFQYNHQITIWTYIYIETEAEATFSFNRTKNIINAQPEISDAFLKIMRYFQIFTEDLTKVIQNFQ